MDKDIEDTLLEAVRNISLMFNKDGDKKREFVDPNGIIILIEKDPNDEENFNVSLFNFKEDENQFPICKVIAYGLLQILDEDLETVFTKGMKKVLDESDENVKKVVQAEVVDFNEYRRVVDNRPFLEDKEDNDDAG
mgnify:FL=1|tara:strand:- start:390 stop:797 length:408 start_codon:yes stop_codon:yes gene_type:complete